MASSGPAAAAVEISDGTPGTPGASSQRQKMQPLSVAAAAATKESPTPRRSRSPTTARGALSARSRPTPRSRSTPRSGSRTARSTISTIDDRPDWDGTPLRPRPPALRGLLAAGGVSAREPWARDESVYNRRFQMWSEYDGHFNLETRAPYSPHRIAMAEIHREAYLGRWMQKFEIGTCLLLLLSPPHAMCPRVAH